MQTPSSCSFSSRPSTSHSRCCRAGSIPSHAEPHSLLLSRRGFIDGRPTQVCPRSASPWRSPPLRVLGEDGPRACRARRLTNGFTSRMPGIKIVQCTARGAVCWRCLRRRRSGTAPGWSPCAPRWRRRPRT
jgi:hypothetical protein